MADFAISNSTVPVNRSTVGTFADLPPTRPWLPTDAEDIMLIFWGYSRDVTGVKADGSQFALSDGTPTKWLDASPAGNHLPTASGTPVYSANGLSTGHPAVSLAGNSAFWRSSGLVVPPGSYISGMAVGIAPATDSAVGRLVSLSAGANDFDGNGVIPILRRSGTSTISGFDNGGFTPAVTIPTLTPALFEGIVAAAGSLSSGVDGTLGSGGSTSTKTPTALAIGVRADGSNDAFWLGSVAEAIVWAGVASSDTLSRLEGYAAWNNGTPLRSRHPYEFAAPTVVVNDNTPLRRRSLMLIAS